MNNKVVIPKNVISAILVVWIAAISQTNAQVGTKSEAVGYYTIDIQPGTNMLVSGFVTAKEHEGTIGSIAAGGTTTTIGLSGASFVSGEFDESSGTPTHYLEVTSPGHLSEGAIIDIVSNTGTDIVLHLSDAEASALGILVGDTVCIRAHVTLRSFFEKSNSGTPPNVLSPGQDFAVIYNADGSSDLHKLVSISSDPAVTNWQYFNTSANADNRIIYPGQAIVLAANAQKSLRMGTGAVSYVKAGPTSIPVYGAGVNIVGQVNPLNGTTFTVDESYADSGLADGDVVVEYENDGINFFQTGIYVKSGPGFNTVIGDGSANFTEGLLIVPNGGTDRILELPSGLEGSN